MLISFTRRFVFIANTKNASTTIEHLLRPYSDIALTHPRYGKHFPYQRVAKKFGFLFGKYDLPIESFFRFGVIREPLDWVVSWYNYRSRERLARTRHPLKAANSTRGVTFEEFVEELLRPGEPRSFARIGSQFLPFVAADGTLGVDYLMPLDRVNADLPEIGKALGLESALMPERETKNVSPKILRVDDVPAQLANRLRAHLAEDVELFRKAEERAFGDVADVIRSKLRDATRQERAHLRELKRARRNSADDTDKPRS